MSLILLLIAFSCIYAKKPIIGIVSNPYPENSDFTTISYTSSNYLQFLESLNAKTLPILFSYSENELDYIIPKINGLLFQGGGRDFRRGTFELQAQSIINKANKAKIPIWFTCQGFELLYYILTDYSSTTLEKSNSWGVALPIYSNMSNKKLSDSKMFKYFSQEEISKLESKDERSTIHFHNLMVSPILHKKYSKLDDILLITTVGYDLDGKQFISSVESKDFTKNKYFAVQFHPEKQAFAKDTPAVELNTLNGLIVRDKIGITFMEEAIKTLSSNYLSDDDQYKWGVFITNEFNLDPGNSIYVYDSSTNNRRPSKPSKQDKFLYP